MVRTEEELRQGFIQSVAAVIGANLDFDMLFFTLYSGQVNFTDEYKMAKASYDKMSQSLISFISEKKPDGLPILIKNAENFGNSLKKFENVATEKSSGDDKEKLLKAISKLKETANDIVNLETLEENLSFPKRT